MNRVIGNVYLTNNYEMFESMLGNRNDARSRMSKIADSVKQAGKYILAPIIVTDKNTATGKYPIVDGQARYLYCKETETPIAYCVVSGLNVNDCIAMNASTSNWKLMDYIRSYADRHIEDYELILRFIENSKYPISISLWALFNNVNKNYADKIKNGTVTVTQSMYYEGMRLIEYWKRFDNIKTNRRTELYIAIGYCYLLNCVDNELLAKKIQGNPRAFEAISNVTDAMEVIEDVYNKRLREHIYIKTEYFRLLDTKGPSFGQMIKDKQSKRHEFMEA